MAKRIQFPLSKKSSVRDIRTVFSRFSREFYFFLFALIALYLLVVFYELAPQIPLPSTEELVIDSMSSYSSASSLPNYLLNSSRFSPISKYTRPDSFFTVIVIPDTQKYTIYPNRTHIFSNQTEWIVAKKELLKIGFVVQLGDLVDHSNSSYEWTVANTSMSILDRGSIPYSVLPGNHDMPTVLYDTYFPASRYTSYSWYGGNFIRSSNPDDNDNNFQLIRINEEDFLFLNLQYCPKEDVLAWATSVIQKYPGRQLILSTHGLFNSNGNLIEKCSRITAFHSLLVLQSRNPFLVLVGHEHGEGVRIDVNAAGKEVYQLLSDYQSRKNGGDGWLRIMTFAPKERRIYVETYSPYLDLYEIDDDSSFVIPYPWD